MAPLDILNLNETRNIIKDRLLRPSIYDRGPRNDKNRVIASPQGVAISQPTIKIFIHLNKKNNIAESVQQ